MSFINDLLINISAFRVTVGNKINALKVLIDGKQNNLTDGLHSKINGNKVDIAFEVNTPVKDKANNDRLIFGNTQATDVVIKGAVANGDFVVKDSTNSNLFRINGANKVPYFPQLPAPQTGVSNNLAIFDSGNGLWKSNVTIADLALSSQIPTNYVTTNTAQTGLIGDKTSSGIWTLGQIRKAGQNDTQMLLAGGGHRPVSDFAQSNSLPKSVYNHPNGILVKTDIPDGSNTMFTMEIEGNSYNTHSPIIMRVQGYLYNTSSNIINTTAISTLSTQGNVEVFIYDGFLHFWFNQPTDFQTHHIKVLSLNTVNRVVSITNAPKPSTGTTKDVSIVVNKIWNSFNDGAGSGLDADLLDGKHASDFALANGYVSLDPTLTNIAQSATDFNTIVNNSVSYISSAVPNRPNNQAGFAFNMAITAGGGTGHGFTIHGGINGEDNLFYRRRLGGVNGANFQVASRTWADSKFALYLPLAGGTMTGAINTTINNILNFNGSNRIQVDTSNIVLGGNTTSSGGVYFRPRGTSIATNEVNINGLGVITTNNGNGNSSQWKQAFDWGNHATQGYITNTALNAYLPLTGGSLSGSLEISTTGGNTALALNANGNGQSELLQIHSSGFSGFRVGTVISSSNINEYYYHITPMLGTRGDTFKILHNGNIGIGEQSPTAKLHVNGNIIATDGTATNHVVTLNQLNTKANTSGTYPNLNVGNSDKWQGLMFDYASPTTANFFLIQEGILCRRMAVADVKTLLGIPVSGYAMLGAAQTFTNINSFTQSPIIPDGTQPNHAVSKQQLDDAVSTATSQVTNLFGGISNYFQDLDVSGGGFYPTDEYFFTLMDPNNTSTIVDVGNHDLHGARLVIQSNSGYGVVTYKGSFYYNGAVHSDILIENGQKKEFVWDVNMGAWREVF